MNILINRSDNLDAAVLTMPMAKLLKEKYPNCKITMLVSEQCSDLFLRHPFIDNFKTYDRNILFFSKIKNLLNIFSEYKPTHYFYVGGGSLPNFISWITRVKFRGGLKARWHTYLFLNKGIRQKRSMVTMHEMEYNLNLLSPLGITYNFKDKELCSPEICLSQDEIETNFNSFRKMLTKNGIETDRKMVFIHPGVVGNSLNWPSRNYARLVFKLEQKYPNKFLFIISHSLADFEFLQMIKDMFNKNEHEVLKKRVYYFNRESSGLRHYMSILTKAAVFVGPSTGTIHIAAALGVPVVSIFSPIKIQSSLRWGPLSKNKDKVKILVPDVICGEARTCALRECPYYECMGKIEIDDVLKQALSLIDF